LWGIALEIVVMVLLVYLPPLQDVFHTTALGPTEVALLVTFPGRRLGADALRRWRIRRRAGLRGLT
jgi:P-type Ca2+ transporter type 2C